MQRRTALVAAALSGVLAGTACHGAPARADAPAHPGSITTSIAGVPAQVPVGGSFSPTFTIRSDSPYRIEVDDFFVSLSNTTAVDSAQGAGIDIRWKDPASGAWRISSQQHSGGVWALSEPARTVWIQPHGTLSIRLYITMNGGAARGTDILTTTGICAYSLFDTSGTNVSGMLGYNHATTQFFFGSASNGTGPNGTGSSAAPGSSSSWSATSQPSAGASGGSADPDDLDAGAPSGTGSSTDPFAAPAAEPSATREPNTQVAASGTLVPVGALVLVAAAAFGCGVLITRRSRGGR